MVGLDQGDAGAARVDGHGGDQPGVGPDGVPEQPWLLEADEPEQPDPAVPRHRGQEVTVVAGRDEIGPLADVLDLPPVVDVGHREPGVRGPDDLVVGATGDVPDALSVSRPGRGEVDPP